MEFQKSDVDALCDLHLVTLDRLKISNRSGLSLNEVDTFSYKYGLRYIRICIVGSNPSTASPDNTPFHKGTKSRKTIDSWFENADFNYMLQFKNIVNYKKVDNKPITKSEINNNLTSIKSRFTVLSDVGLIIAVGKDAQLALDKADIYHFKMPHPSGLNRFWNDKTAAETKIKNMLEWIKSHIAK